MNRLKIKGKFFLIQCIIMSLVCLASILAFQNVADNYEKQVYLEAVEVLQLLSRSIDHELKEIEQLSFQISTDAALQDQLLRLKENQANYENYKLKEQVSNRLLQFMDQKSYISSISLIDSHGSPMSTVTYNIETPDANVVDIVKKENGSNVWLYGGKETPYALSVREVRGVKNVNLQHYGILMIWIDMDQLTEKYLNLSREKHFVIAEDQQIVYSTQYQLFERSDLYTTKVEKGFVIQKINGVEYLISHLRSSENSDLIYYNILPYEGISFQTTKLRYTMIIIFITIFVLTLIINWIATQSITQPIALLTERIKRVQRGDFDIPEMYYDFPNRDEIGHLNRNFRIMLEKINELLTENYQKQLIIKDTEYRALQAQINPHFLYNTLDTINWMAHINEQAQIAEMVEALGQMLRSIIGKKESLITLSEELSIVEDYITIQKHRFQERLDFTFEIEPGIEQYLVPKLIIQPLVENAILHGLENTMEICHIRLLIQLDTSKIVIILLDDGPGIEASRLQQFKKGNIQSSKTGIGLKNITDRLQIMFGEESHFNIESEPNVSTQIRMEIPLRVRD